jgi:hypothetical protein
MGANPKVSYRVHEAFWGQRRLHLVVANFNNSNCSGGEMQMLLEFVLGARGR